VIAERAVATRPEPAREPAPAAFAAAPAAPLAAVHAAGYPRHDFRAIPVRPRLQRQPAEEDPAVHARRLAAANGARNAAEHVRRAIARGLLWPGEAATAGGVNLGGPTGWDETTAERQARLRQLTVDLIRLSIDLDTNPITADRLATKWESPGGGSWEITGPQLWQDVLVLYTHWKEDHGADSAEIFHNHPYIETEPLPTPQVAPVRTPRATDTGIYLIVPDAVNEPLVYQRLTGYEGWRRGVIVTVWVDDFGYFYMSQGRKIYLPRRP
jgi:hypothetical protein